MLLSLNMMRRRRSTIWITWHRWMATKTQPTSNDLWTRTISCKRMRARYIKMTTVMRFLKVSITGSTIWQTNSTAVALDLNFQAVLDLKWVRICRRIGKRCKGPVFHQIRPPRQALAWQMAQSVKEDFQSRTTLIQIATYRVYQRTLWAPTYACKNQVWTVEWPPKYQLSKARKAVWLPKEGMVQRQTTKKYPNARKTLK